MKFSILFIIVSFLSYNFICQETSVFDEFKAHKDGIGLWWSGHNGWIIKSGDLVVSTDILLDYDKRNKPPSISL